MVDIRDSARFLRNCQVLDGDIAGTVCPWELNAGMPPREDFHDTMQALYVWSLPENFNENREPVEMAVRYMKKRRRIIMEEPEPMKSYDCACLLLGVHMYLRNVHDEDAGSLEEHSIDNLKEHFSCKAGLPAHNAREYSNPYLKAAIFGCVLRERGEKTDFLEDWLKLDSELKSPESEPLHIGPGHQYPHDFVSTFGSKLWALSVISCDFDFKQAVSELPSGFIARQYDEVSFNSTVLFGLAGAISRTEGEVRNAFERASVPLRRELELRAENGGWKRGHYFPIRESWTTFYVTLADTLMEHKTPFYK